MGDGGFRRLGLWWLVALVALAGLGFVVAGRTLVGSTLVVLALVGAGIARLVLTRSQAGGLAVRSKAVDAVTWFVLAGALVAALNVVSLRRR